LGTEEFSLTPCHPGLRRVHNFGPVAGDGLYPQGPLVEAIGKGQWTTFYGGANGQAVLGVVNNYATAAPGGNCQLSCTTNALGAGQHPQGCPAFDRSSTLHANAAYGGSLGSGSVHSINASTGGSRPCPASMGPATGHPRGRGYLLGGNHLGGTAFGGANANGAIYGAGA